GVRVTPSQNDLAVKALNFRAANDSPERDPVAFQLSGSNQSIGGPYTLIAEGEIADFNQSDAWERDTWISEPIEIDNDVVFEHYEIIFAEIRDADAANSMQINEIELLGTPPGVTPIPEELTRGAALDLNGEGQYVESDVTAGDLGIAGNAPKTMEAWAYTRDWDDSGGLLNMGAPGSDGEDFSLRVTGTQDLWRAQLWGGFDVDFEYPSHEQWVHLALVHTGSETIAYANGELIASAEQEIDTSDAEPFRVGWWPNRDESETFDGMVAEVRVWDFARPQAAIMADMNERLTGNEDGLLLHWPLDENEGDTAFDSSPNNNDGTIVGAPEWVSEEVPDLAGLDWEEAATTLEEAGFQVYIDYVELGVVETGQVHAQAPGPGQTSAPGWTVVLQVESEPQSFAPAAPAWLMLIVMTAVLTAAGFYTRKRACAS
ncbi:MAG: LamG-like jellyroll fold domain-containing protein, partial [Candidatus Hydrogenedentota bacterium]